MALLVGNVRLSEGGEQEALLERLGIPPERLRSFKLVKKSLDARHRRQVWQAVFRVEVEGEQEVLGRHPASVRPWTARDDGRYGLVDPSPKRRAWPPGHRVVVVGAGPAGLFAALYLAESGAQVTLVDRGGPVEDRVPAVNGFWRRQRPLDPENNILFGEGGSGTFSDGKIYTRRRDGELGYIFRRLVDFGADEGVMRESLAHLGTDRVRRILPVFRQGLVDLGVDVRYHARVDALVVEDGRCRGVVLAGGETLPADAVVFGPGHSARDTLEMLVASGAAAEARPIAVGARIEHPQTLIDAARYGTDERGDLPAASYRLAHQPDDGRKAHTFCMCPGGMVVPAGNDPDRVVVNGMSFAARRAFWANSAVIVEVRPEDYGGDGPLAGFAWQDAIERRCFEAAGSDYRAPAQRVVDLAAGRPSTDLPRTSYPMQVTPCDLRELLPDFVIDGMLAAIEAFDRKLPGFASGDAVLIAPETRTTSPVRFLRDDRQESTSLPGLYPVGEGAGYAGGIISSALDGYRAGRALAEAFPVEPPSDPAASDEDVRGA